VQFAVNVPNLAEYADPRVLVSLARDAEAAGWDGFFVWDHVAYHQRGWPVTDPWVAISAVAAVTERVRVGVLVTILARRRPSKVARETVALDHLSGGRAVFGAGIGSAVEEEFEAFGEDGSAVTRAERLDEALEVITGLWSGEPFWYDGRHHHVDDALFLPRPVQQPRIPVWVAGRWPNRPPFRRAARWDGVFPTFADVSDPNVAPSLLREAVDYTYQHRSKGAAPLDVVLEGQTPGAPPLDEYADAGLTWWIEKCGWWRGDLADNTARVRQGPPS
jgi:alkanesulfonate monooxygenase SsuD/methylene tetrahydromethanopterin reductase-like flavin-dependent oxidoreductase (luciferase family)